MDARFRAGAMILALVTVMTSAAASCEPIQQAVKQAPKYSDELVTAIGKLTGKNGDDAIKYLDDAAAEGKVAAQAATLTWGGRINAIADDIVARHFAVPEDQAAARAFVVGTACDAFKAQQESLLGLVTETEMQSFVMLNRLKSRRPAIFGRAEFVGDVITELNKALRAGDISAAFPGLAQAIVCDRLG